MVAEPVYCCPLQQVAQMVLLLAAAVADEQDPLDYVAYSGDR